MHGYQLIVSRFLPASVAKKYDLDIPDYPGVDQILEVGGQSMSEKVLGTAERQM